MSIHMSCPHCQRAYDLADAYRGKSIRCKECQGIFKVEVGQDARIRAQESTSPPPLPTPRYDTPPPLPTPGYGLPSASAAVDNLPGPVFEEQIFFSGKEMVKSVLWLGGWLVFCLAFAIGMPILGYLAITQQAISLKAIVTLIACFLAALAGLIGVQGCLATLRLFLFSTIPFSSHYLITADRLRRYSRAGKLVEEIPFANVAEVRLVTRRLTEVFGEEADANIKAKIVHINLHNPDDPSTTVDRHFLRWSQQVHDTDLALSEDLMDVPIKTVFKKIKKRWEQWQEGPGRDADRRPLRAARRGRVPWFKRPVVIISALLGVAALGGLVCVLAFTMIPRERIEQPIDVGQKPIAEVPAAKLPQPAVEAAIEKQPAPPPAAPDKATPATLPGLIAYWPLDEGQGPTTLEETRKQAAVRHGGEWIQGVKGSALRFNGTSDYVDLGDDARLNFGPGAPFTLAGWVATEANSGPICVFRKTKGFGVIAVLVVDGNLRGWVRDNNSGFGGVQLTSGPVKDGKWHHFALTRQPDGTVELFLDARPQGKDVGKNSGGPITTDLRALASDRFVVATGKNATPYLAATIDEVCLYDRVLNPGEIGILASRKQ